MDASLFRAQPIDALCRHMRSGPWLEIRRNIARPSVVVLPEGPDSPNTSQVSCPSRKSVSERPSTALNVNSIVVFAQEAARLTGNQTFQNSRLHDEPGRTDHSPRAPCIEVSDAMRLLRVIMLRIFEDLLDRTALRPISP
jgi:hypothetical protein